MNGFIEVLLGVFGSVALLGAFSLVIILFAEVRANRGAIWRVNTGKGYIGGLTYEQMNDLTWYLNDISVPYTTTMASPEDEPTNNMFQVNGVVNGSILSAYISSQQALDFFKNYLLVVGTFNQRVYRSTV